MTLLEEIAKELNLEEIKVDERRAGYEELGPWRECGSLEASNWTPWWGGDFEGKVRDPNTLKPTSAPTSETVKGVLRWTLRAALAASVQNADYQQLDELLAPVYGGVVRRYNKSEEHLDSLVRIRVKSRVDDQCDRNIISTAAGVVRSVFSIPDRRRREQQLARYYTYLGKEVGPRDAYLKVLTVTRFELSTLGKKPDEIVSILPVPPGCVKLEISVDVSNKLRVLTGLDECTICELTLYALIYALSVRGLGRGANRGFGRFSVSKLRVGEDCDIDGDSIWRIAQALLKPEEVEKALQEIHEKLVEKARVLAEGGSRSKGCQACTPSLRVISNPGQAPGVIIRVVRNAKHPAPAPITRLRQTSKVQVVDVYDALSAIGRAFVKNVWKKYSVIMQNYGGIQAPGVGLHSWIAGLPRWQQVTGYALIEPNKLSVPQNCSTNACLHHKRVKSIADSGRRASSIISYPLPNASTIVVLAYVTLGDHEAVLTGRKKLYHIGRHGRPGAPCRHVVDVFTAAGQVSVGRPQQVCTRCKGQGCGHDQPAGIVYTNNVVQAQNARDLVVQAYEAALEHIVNVLS